MTYLQHSDGFFSSKDTKGINLSFIYHNYVFITNVERLKTYAEYNYCFTLCDRSFNFVIIMCISLVIGMATAHFLSISDQLL